MNKLIKNCLTILIVLVLGAVFVYYQNNYLVVDSYDISCAGAPDGCVIVQLSDLHTKSFGNENSRLVNKVAALSPDIIMLSGDLIDAHTSLEDAAEYINTLVPQLCALCPVYYTLGNHEIESAPDFICELVERAGAVVLRNELTSVEFSNGSFNLIGMSDLNDFNDWNSGLETARTLFSQRLDELCRQAQCENDYPVILLTHRPELADVYDRSGAALTFCGHAHGGQIRLPFIGGLAAPGQGLFPKYTDGVYRLDNSEMVVSRGLGNSVFPLRLFNYPQIVAVTLHSE